MVAEFSSPLAISEPLNFPVPPAIGDMYVFELPITSVHSGPRFSDSPEQKGWQAQAAEMKALWQAAEVERDRLNEFVTVLQKR